MKTKITSSKKAAPKNQKAKVKVISKVAKHTTSATPRAKTAAHLSTSVKTAVKTTVKKGKVAPLPALKTRTSSTNVSVAERLTAARLIKSAEATTTPSRKNGMALVRKEPIKLVATKISRSEPSELGSRVITGRFSVDATPSRPALAVKGSVDKAPVGISATIQAIIFKAGDKIVYPGHGVGEIEGIRTTVLGDQEHHIYNIKILDSGMKVMVPVSQASAVGLRKIIDKKAIDEVYSILRDRDFKIDTQTWNRRFREYSQKIKTGSVFEIAMVLRDLSVLSADKELSFGEKKMLDMAESLLVSEIAIARARPHDKVVLELRELFA